MLTLILSADFSSASVSIHSHFFCFLRKGALKLKTKISTNEQSDLITNPGRFNNIYCNILLILIKFSSWPGYRINSVIVRVPECYSFDFCLFDSDILYYLHCPFATLCPWHQTNSGHDPLNPAVLQHYIFELSLWNICQENVKLLSRLLHAWLKHTHLKRVLLYGGHCISDLRKNCVETENVL